MDITTILGVIINIYIYIYLCIYTNKNMNTSNENDLLCIIFLPLVNGGVVLLLFLFILIPWMIHHKEFAGIGKDGKKTTRRLVATNHPKGRKATTLPFLFYSTFLYSVEICRPSNLAFF